MDGVRILGANNDVSVFEIFGLESTSTRYLLWREVERGAGVRRRTAKQENLGSYPAQRLTSSDHNKKLVNLRRNIVITKNSFNLRRNIL
jgi:hypothetical protein